MISADVELALQRHLDAVVAKARARGDPTASAVREGVRAVRLTHRMIDVLHLDGFRYLIPSSSGRPQVLAVFDRSADLGVHEPVVLKCYGRKRPWEARIQRRWADAGLAVVPILSHGDTPHTWLLSPLVERKPLFGEEREKSSLFTVTTEVAQLMRAVHRCPGTGAPGAPWRRLEAAMAGHATSAVRALESAGYTVRVDWRTLVHGVYATPTRVVLHGDLADGNVIRDQRGGLQLLDASAYLGPREFDAARWCARVGGASAARPLLRCWTRTDCDLHYPTAEVMLGLELLVEAGVDVVVRREQEVSGSTGSSATELLSASESLLISAP